MLINILQCTGHLSTTNYLAPTLIRTEVGILALEITKYLQDGQRNKTNESEGENRSFQENVTSNLYIYMN